MSIVYGVEFGGPRGATYVTTRTGQRVSPWHDVPMRPDSTASGDPLVVNMVCEVPAGTRIKYEVTVDEPPFNPIRRDVTKDGRPRSYPFRMPWDYGMVPGTWEDPAHAELVDGVRIPGDGDPLDVVLVDSGVRTPVRRVGAVRRVRVVGALALIDSGELDWKLLAVPFRRSGANAVGIDDATVERIRRWFTTYKPDAGNRFAYGGAVMDPLPVLATARAAYLGRRQRLLGGGSGIGSIGSGMLLGGMLLGDGGQGAVSSLDDLADMYGGNLTIVSVSMDDGSVSYTDAPSRERLAKLGSRIAFKHSGSKPERASEEFDISFMIARLVAAASPDEKKRQIEAAFVRSSPFVFVDSRIVVGAVVGTDSRVRLPFYRRFHGSLADVCILASARASARASASGRPAIMPIRSPLSAAEAVLDMLAALASIGVHHLDVKEENVLNGDGRYVLCDFGHSVVPGTTFDDLTAPPGTDGYQCPLLLAKEKDADGPELLAQNWLLRRDAFGGPLEVYDSYESAIRLSSDTALEKCDLFSLGIMLGRFRPVEADGHASSRYTAFVRRLIRADGNALWTARGALVECRALLSDRTVSTGSVHIPRFGQTSPKLPPGDDVDDRRALTRGDLFSASRSGRKAVSARTR